jgi:hypothetical protein
MFLSPSAVIYCLSGQVHVQNRYLSALHGITYVNASRGRLQRSAVIVLRLLSEHKLTLKGGGLWTE